MFKSRPHPLTGCYHIADTPPMPTQEANLAVSEPILGVLQLECFNKCLSGLATIHESSWNGLRSENDVPERSNKTSSHQPNTGICIESICTCVYVLVYMYIGMCEVCTLHCTRDMCRLDVQIADICMQICECACLSVVPVDW